MIPDRNLVALVSVRTRFQSAPMPREDGERWFANSRPGRYELVPVPSCRCCGAPAWENLRCTKHQDRNPCVVEGCTRTGKAHGHLGDDHLICGRHWRTYVPPRSRERRAYNAHWRRKKRLGGWTNETADAFNRFWETLMRRVRRLSTEGALDEAEIRRLFGWDDDG